MYEVIIEKRFTSAHFIRIGKGKNEERHRHNWKVRVEFQGKHLKAPEGYLVDFEDVLERLDKIVDRMNFKNLNDLPPFDRINPSAENIARWIHEEFCSGAPSAGIPSCVTVWERKNCAARYRPEN